MSNALEVILSRHLAETLSIPIFLVDPEGNLLFYNESAEEVLGRRFEDTGPMPMEEWSTVFDIQDESGNPVPPEELPLVITLTKQIPAQKSFIAINFQGEKVSLSVTSFPLIGHSDKMVGAIAIFWKNS